MTNKVINQIKRQIELNGKSFILRETRNRYRRIGVKLTEVIKGLEKENLTVDVYYNSKGLIVVY